MKGDGSDAEIVYERDDSRQHLHQYPFELNQPSPLSLASLPLRPRPRRVLQPQESSSDSETGSVTNDEENPFELLQQQLLTKEGRRTVFTDKASFETEKRLSNTRIPPNDSEQTHFPTASPEDWPVCNNDWNDDTNEERLPAKRTKPKRAQYLPNGHCPISDVVQKELERSRKRFRKTFDFSRLTPQISVVTPLTQSTTTDTSIAGLRPKHWGGAKERGARLSDSFMTQFPSRSLKLTMDTRGTFSLSSAAKTSKSVKCPTKSFTPSSLGKHVVANTTDDELLKENEQPWYLRTKATPGHRNSKSTPKKKAIGPLLQKLGNLRASLTADVVRLQSNMSMQNPRKEKVYMDIQLLGSATAMLDRHSVVLGKFDNTYAWIVLEKAVSGPKRLRVYNPIPLRIEPAEGPVTHVVICTQLYEIL